LVIVKAVYFLIGVYALLCLLVGFYSTTWLTLRFLNKYFNNIFYAIKGRRLMIDAWPYKYWLLLDYQNDVTRRRKKSLHDPNSKYLQLAKPELKALLKCTYISAWTSMIIIWGVAIDFILIPSPGLQ